MLKNKSIKLFKTRDKKLEIKNRRVANKSKKIIKKSN